MEPILKKFIADLVRWAFKPPSKPGKLTLTVTGEEQENGVRKNITDITLPPLAADNPDMVVTRRFGITETAGGTDVFPPTDYAWDFTTIVGVKLAQGVEIKLRLVDIDAADNESVPQEETYTPSDQTAPAQPGSFQLAVTGEVDEP